MTRGEKICAFIERYVLIPEGAHVGKPMKSMPYQRKFVLAVYDNPHGTSRAYLSVARKNGKSALIAAVVLAHLIGQEAKQNSQIISGARSRDQASLVFKLAEKMVRLSAELSEILRIVPSQKMLILLPWQRGIQSHIGREWDRTWPFTRFGHLGRGRPSTRPTRCVHRSN